MPKFQPRQAVVPAQSDRKPEVHDVLRVTELPEGEPQYRIKGRESGTERVVRESEIKAAFEPS